MARPTFPKNPNVIVGLDFVDKDVAKVQFTNGLTLAALYYYFDFDIVDPKVPWNGFLEIKLKFGQNPLESLSDTITFTFQYDGKGQFWYSYSISRKVVYSEDFESIYWSNFLGIMKKRQP
jgi:hypothetical protein